MGYRSLKVIQTGTTRKLGCGFLFAFHSNYGSILHQFRDETRYCSKIVIFLYPLAFDVPLRGSSSEYCRDVWYRKLEWCGYSKVCLFISTQSTNVTDRQTDERTDTA